jgi:hypothetical protein
MSDTVNNIIRNGIRKERNNKKYSPSSIYYKLLLHWFPDKEQRGVVGVETRRLKQK